MRIVQMLAGYAEGDAISEEARLIQRYLIAQGHRCELVAPADTIAPGAADECRICSTFRMTDVDLLIFHYSTHSEATEIYLAANCPKVVRYHNITPGTFFRGIDQTLARQLDRAHAQLAEVVHAAQAVWSVSDYNSSDFGAGLAVPVITVPLFSEGLVTTLTPDPGMLRLLGGGLTNFFFVGRIAPNKNVEILIEAYAWYHRGVDPRSRLVLAGSEWSCPRYFALLQLFAARLNLPNVLFLNYLLNEQLAACYTMASVYVCASRHEGYCLPLVDAMHYGIPVLANHCGGMPQTVGSGGLLLRDASAKEWAGAMHLLAHDAGLRERVLAGQQKRLVELDRSREEELAERIAQVTG